MLVVPLVTDCVIVSLGDKDMQVEQQWPVWRWFAVEDVLVVVEVQLNHRSPQLINSVPQGVKE